MRLVVVVVALAWLAGAELAATGSGTSAMRTISAPEPAPARLGLYKFNYTEAGANLGRQQSRQVPVRAAPGETRQSQLLKSRLQRKRQISGGGGSRRDDPWFLDPEPNHPAQPYRFVYNIKGRNGQTEQYRQEVGDGKFLTGSYGYVLPDGIYRHVDYVADERGFRAFIRTSEPGTANQNPADVVINSAAPPTPGVTYAGAPAAATATNYSHAPYSPYDYSTLNQDLGQLPRRPPGDIVGPPTRYNSSDLWAPQPAGLSGASYQSSYFEPSRIVNLTSANRWLPPPPPPPPPSTPFKSDHWPPPPSSIGQTLPAATFSQNPFPPRQTHLPAPTEASSDRNTTGSGLSLSNQWRPPLQPASLSQPASLDRPAWAPASPHWPPGPPRPPTGTLKLLYDQVPASGGGAREPKINYDNDSNSLPASEQRQRALHEARLRASTGALGGLLELPPLAPATVYARPLAPLAAGQWSRGESQSHQSEEHHRHSSSGSLVSTGARQEPATEFKEHSSGSQSASGQLSQFEARSESLPPPPPPQFEAVANSQGATKGGHPLLSPPYHHRLDLLSPRPPAPPTPPEEPRPPVAPPATTTTTTTEAPSPANREPHKEEPRRAGGVKGGREHQWQPARPVRMPEDFRSSMLMNDLRSMQNTLGLPQPPRLARANFELDSNVEQALNKGFQLVDQGYLARARKIDQLLAGPQQQQQSRQVGGQASVRSRVVVTTPEPAVSPDAPGKTLTGRQQEEQHKHRLATGLLAKQPSQEEVELLTNELGTAFNETFDARRLPSLSSAKVLAPAKLQAEKVSELEKFQQRLRAQQLLLEQQTPSKLAAKQGATRPTSSSSQENSQVNYDEDEDNNNSGVGGKGRSSLAKDQEANNSSNSKPLTYKWLNPLEVDVGNKTRRQSLGATLGAGSNSSSAADELDKRSEFAKSLQAWPSVGLNRSEEARPRDGSAPDGASKPANTINLDFINSVTALSVDHLNPFALASVNPAVQRQQQQEQQQQVKPAAAPQKAHKMGEAAPPSATTGVATASARYFSSPELLAALDQHERRDTSGQLRGLLSAADSAEGADVGQAGVAARAGWASNHRFSVGPPAAPYMLAASSTSARLVRDGFEVRDRAQQVDGHRFYEVLARGA